MSLIRKGWSFDAVRRRHLENVHRAVARGVEFRHMDLCHRAGAEQLVRQHIAGASDWVIPENIGGVVATVQDVDDPIGALVAGAVKYGQWTQVLVQYLVVDPAWRGTGVGVVLLGMIGQKVEPFPGAKVFVGGCAKEEARFYQHSGYDVYEPGHKLDVPYLPVPLTMPDDALFPCWFVKGLK